MFRLRRSWRCRCPRRRQRTRDRLQPWRWTWSSGSRRKWDSNARSRERRGRVDLADLRSWKRHLVKWISAFSEFGWNKDGSAQKWWQNIFFMSCIFLLWIALVSKILRREIALGHSNILMLRLSQYNFYLVSSIGWFCQFWEVHLGRIKSVNYILFDDIAQCQIKILAQFISIFTFLRRVLTRYSGWGCSTAVS